MSHLASNLALLARRQPELADLLRTTPSSRIQLTSARNGSPIGAYRRSGGAPVPLHSRYDPLLEAHRILKDIHLAGVDYFILLGFGFGYGLEALLENTSRTDAHIFVIESDLEILRAACEVRDLTSCLSVPDLHFAWPATGDDLARQWQQFFNPVYAQESVFISHPPSLVLDPALFKSAVEIIQSRTLQIFTDINTMIGSSQMFLENFVANFRRIAAMPGVKSLARRFAGVPCALVSAGPSLDRNIHELRAFQHRVLILSADTALKPLLAAGIEPAFVMTADPRRDNYLHLKDAGTRDALLVAEATAYPDSLEEFAGRALACTFEGSSLATFGEVFTAKGKLRAWGSVATMCLDFALLLGCDPILFLGQDLAFSEGRTYCSGLHWEHAWFAGVHTPEEWEDRQAAILAQSKLVGAEDAFGYPVASTDKLLSYWNWIAAEIEKHPQVRFINATEGGILKDRVQIMSLREALHRFCSEERNLSREARRLFAEAAPRDSEVDTTLLEKIRQEILMLPAILGEGFDLGRKARSGMSVREIARSCERVKQAVHALTRLAPILDCFNQTGNIAFLRRRAAQTDQDASAREILDQYLDYFQSIANAAQPVENAIRKLLPA
jgi:hypothetical protein